MTNMTNMTNMTTTGMKVYVRSCEHIQDMIDAYLDEHIFNTLHKGNTDRAIALLNALRKCTPGCGGIMSCLKERHRGQEVMFECPCGRWTSPVVMDFHVSRSCDRCERAVMDTYTGYHSLPYIPGPRFLLERAAIDRERAAMRARRGSFSNNLSVQSL